MTYNKFERDWILQINSIKEKNPQLSTEEIGLLKKYNTRPASDTKYSGLIECPIESFLCIISDVERIKKHIKLED